MSKLTPWMRNKIIINTAVATVLTSALITPAQADLLEFDFDVLFTIVNAVGVPIQNTSYPYYGDTT